MLNDTLKLKICGMRDPDNISQVAALKPDYLGFIFYPKSPRFVETLALDLVENLRYQSIDAVAVTVNMTFDSILQLVDKYGFTHVQLHGSETPETCLSLKARGLTVLKAFSIAEPSDLEAVNAYTSCCDYFLFDTKTPSFGGSGNAFDWNILKNYSGETPFFLSGGIGPEDALRIRSFKHPLFSGVDLNSRFEIHPAWKNPELLHSFIHPTTVDMRPRINQLFDQKSSGILSVYYTAGYPNLEDTMPILRELQANQVDLVEIGIPFSDPMADGPVIQASGNAAIKNGMSLRKLFEQLSDMRSEIRIPVILMGYLNVVMQYGLEAFCKDCKRVGIDGVILPDLPMSDYLNEFKPMMDAYGLAMVLLITPDTSDARIREIDQNTSSFIYMVSSASTTGAQKSFNDDKQAYFRRINGMGLRNPRLIGFGISNKATLDAAFQNASGAIIGSRFIECLKQEKSVTNAVKALLDGLK